MIKLVTIIGARPQIIKAAALSRAIKNGFSTQITEIIVHTPCLRCPEQPEHQTPWARDAFASVRAWPRGHSLTTACRRQPCRLCRAGWGSGSASCPQLPLGGWGRPPRRKGEPGSAGRGTPGYPTGEGRHPSRRPLHSPPSERGRRPPRPRLPRANRTTVNNRTNM